MPGTHEMRLPTKAARGLPLYWWTVLAKRMASRTEETSSGVPAAPIIECHTDLRAFFHETLTRALASRKVEAPPTTEYYLVSLLAVLGHDTAPLARSFVELEIANQTEEADAAGSSRVQRFQAVGDQALSVSGLFDAHLERHGISRTYVADLGARAYRTAAQLAASSRRPQAQVFFDLGEHFGTYAAVLDQVRENTALGTPDDVLSLYERYQRTHSPLLLERLMTHGVFDVSDRLSATEEVC
jgi:hypothetical protein